MHGRLRVTVLASVLLLAGGRAPAVAAQQAAPQDTIQMTAKKYEFDPATITVKQGQRVKLVITATDRDHGIKIAGYSIEQRLPKGVPETVEFTADKVGTFPFECSVMCGLGHHRMKGKLVVEPAGESPSSSQ